MVGLERGGNEDNLRRTIDMLKNRIADLEAEAVDLRARDRFLSKLENAGVDNWPGYDYVMSE